MVTVTPKLVAKIFQVLMEHLKAGTTITLKQLTTETRTLGGNELSVAAVLNGIYKFDQKYLNDANMKLVRKNMPMKDIEYRALTLTCYEKTNTLYPVWMTVGDLNTDADIMRSVNNQLTLLRSAHGPKPEPKAPAKKAVTQAKDEKALVSELELRTTPSTTRRRKAAQVELELPSQSGGSGGESVHLRPQDILEREVRVPFGLGERRPAADRGFQIRDTAPVEPTMTGEPLSLGDKIRLGLAGHDITAYGTTAGTVDLEAAWADAAMDTSMVQPTREIIEESQREPRQSPIRTHGESEVRHVNHTDKGYSKYVGFFQRLARELFECALSNQTITFEQLCDRMEITKVELSRLLRVTMQELPDTMHAGLLRNLLVFIEKSPGVVPYWYQQNSTEDVSYDDLKAMRTFVADGLYGKISHLAQAAVNEIEKSKQDKRMHVSSMQLAVRGTLSMLLHSLGAEQYELQGVMHNEFKDYHDSNQASFYLDSPRYGMIICHLVDPQTLRINEFTQAKVDFWTTNGYVQKPSEVNPRFMSYYRAFPVPHVISIAQ